ncbi:hypothetical protein FACS1894130_11900 [Spirochaetia bacterium]|nr:hypothetical protein FACS1894130_11900 [Spirochaetia bacterium]
MGLAYVTHKNDYKTIMTQGDHGKLNDAHPLLLLPGRGGLQTINGNNIMNALDFGRVPAFSGEELRGFFDKNNYVDFDCGCLHICKRRQLVKLFLKTVRFIVKQFK